MPSAPPRTLAPLPISPTSAPGGVLPSLVPTAQPLPSGSFLQHKAEQIRAAPQSERVSAGRPCCDLVMGLRSGCAFTPSQAVGLVAFSEPSSRGCGTSQGPRFQKGPLFQGTPTPCCLPPFPFPPEALCVTDSPLGPGSRGSR